MSDENKHPSSEVEQARRDEILEQYLESLPYPPYPVQEEALFSWFSSQQGILVCAPTGTGKTLIAEAALYEALKLGKRAFFTTPLIALTDQKFRELRETVVRWGFDAETVGLVTGNRKVNPDAPVQVVVAEILLNRLQDTSGQSMDDLWAVVMDEFHSFNDSTRGIVWEFGLSLLPPHVKTLLLSATIGNSQEFVSWLGHRHDRSLNLVESSVRKVPLSYRWVDDLLLPDLMVEMFQQEASLRATPALVFCFNREECWNVADLFRGRSLVTESQKKALIEEIDRYDWSKGAGPKMKQILMRGIGVHHAGVLPRYRRIVEDLFQKKLLSVTVCTETLAAGINLPARSVVLPSLMKGPFNKKKLVEISGAQQMFGRAGRPQYDDKGFVFSLAHPDDVKYNKWKEKYDQIPEDTKDPGLLKAKKQLKKKMPKRRDGVTYWSEKQFETLQTSSSANLESRGAIPWQLLAFMIQTQGDIKSISTVISKRLLPSSKLDSQFFDLNRRLISLWQANLIELQPAPPAAKPPTDLDLIAEDSSGEKEVQEKEEPDASEKGEETGAFGAGLFSVAIKEEVKPKEEKKKSPEKPTKKTAKQKIQEYKPTDAIPQDRLQDFVRLRAIHPVFGMYLIDQLEIADDNERILAIEGLLELPSSVGRATWVPKLDELPLGPLAIERLHPQLLRLGLATEEELVGREEEEDGPRKWTEEPPERMISLPHKIQRLFQYHYGLVDDLSVRPVWVIGRLREFGWDFNSYVTSYKLQKQEGMIFRHMLRAILLVEEVAEVIPKDCQDPDAWANFWYDLADDMIDCCESIDAQGTEETLSDTRPRMAKEESSEE